MPHIGNCFRTFDMIVILVEIIECYGMHRAAVGICAGINTNYLTAAKAACRGCHSQYKDRYKKEMRDRVL